MCVAPSRQRPSLQPVMTKSCFREPVFLEGWDVQYNIIFCYIANILLHNRNLFSYIAFNLMLCSLCYISYAT